MIELSEITIIINFGYDNIIIVHRYQIHTTIQAFGEN